jgi:hypothetical protein
MAGKKKNTRLFCVVCKKWFVVHDEKEFRNSGHYVDAPNGKHLLEPDLGRSTVRHRRAVIKDQDVRVARQKAARKERESTKEKDEVANG